MIRALLSFPARTIVLGFATLIAIGTILLALPVSSSGPGALPLADAFFVATSAATVTGLSTIDVRMELSSFGMVVLLAVIQLGGIGIMGAAFGALVAVGRRVSMLGLFAARDELGSIDSPRGMARILRNLVVLTFAIEGVAALILFVRLLTLGETVPTALFGAVFDAVNAFCNAGFDILPDGAAAYLGDPVIAPVLSVTILLGGLGFPVLVELWRLTRHPRGRGRTRPRTSITAKLVIYGSLVLTAIGIGSMLIFEWDNPATLGGLSLGERLPAAVLLGVTSRTAGFQPVPFEAMGDPVLLIHTFLMFVGTGPVSTGGGIKVTTLLVVLLVLRAQIRGSEHITAFDRRIPAAAAGRALTLLALGLGLVMAGTFALVVAEGLELLPAMFEATSAFGTVGLSLGVTGDLDAGGRAIICMLMFMGRIGPITVVAALARRRRPTHVTYPQEEVALG